MVAPGVRVDLDRVPAMASGAAVHHLLDGRLVVIRELVRVVVPTEPLEVEVVLRVAGGVATELDREPVGVVA